ncbi:MULTISPECIES: hypothetical protein [Citrobacter]|uniref:hypothetical protein n=1 Tax=Citrobacter TaxID=544 RepID=UPI0019050405|nr:MULTISPECIES: hypothetical protein [Citrobacter]EKT9263066.1 hypothetical protein [Citrobacter freundii]EKW0769144.1 hypothetical protein [Citrobacter freundii]MBJ9053938.1 hypothetical protein [Citrobacter freundii]MCR3679789.1 hypothetical protein [Citrobacter freundii]MDM3216844.1 hypothetical protein [Citrobacter sp. Cf084]
MPFDHDDPVQLLQLRVGALEYLVKQLAAAQPDNVLALLKENTEKQIELWEDKSPEIVEIMKFSLDMVPKK